MVLVEIEGVVYDVPVANEDPPVLAPYQLIVPALDVAPRVTVPASHTEPGVVPVILGLDVTVTVTSNRKLLSQPVTVCDA